MDLIDSSHLQIGHSSASCGETNIRSTKLNMIALLVTDIALLLIMLFGLLRLGFNEPGVYGLGRLMWRQVGVCASRKSRCLQCTDMLIVGKGLVWLFLSTIAWVPPVVSVASPMYPSCCSS